MSTLNVHANNVLGEFSFLPPEHILSFESVKRKFVRVLQLEKQKLGFSDTDKTLKSEALDISSEVRDRLLSDDITATGEIYPSLIELAPLNAGNVNLRHKVEIIPLDQIASYEGSRAIAFYGLPMRYRLAWNAWNEGTLTIYYDEIDDFMSIDGADTISFPSSFLVFIEKKTKLALIGDLRLSLSWIFPKDQQEQLGLVLGELNKIEQSTLVEVAEWQRQFEKWKNQDLNEAPRLRRGNTELMYRNHNNTSRGFYGGIPADEDLIITVDGGVV